MNKYQTKIESFEYYFVEKGVCQSTDDEQFKKVEEQIGVTLPADYASFLVEYGGTTLDGGDEYVAFPYLEEYPRGKIGLLNVFFGIIPGNGYDIVDNYLAYKGRMPFNLLPIANDPGGNVICLAIYGEDEGKVYFWDHEEEDVVDEGIEPSRDNLYLVAHSFEEFINSLYIWKYEDD